MAHEPGGSRLAVAMVASVLVHVVAAIAAVHLASAHPADVFRSVDERDSELPEPEMRPRDRPDPLVALGIRRSRDASINWIGFDSPEEHRTDREFPTDQPALSPEAGENRPVAPPGEPVEAEEVEAVESAPVAGVEEAVEGDAEQVVAQEAVEAVRETEATHAPYAEHVQAEIDVVRPETPVDAVDPSTLPAERDDRPAIVPLIAEFLEAVRSARATVRDVSEGDAPSEAAASASADEEAAPRREQREDADARRDAAGDAPASQADTPAMESDREATPTSREITLDQRSLGRVVAAEGLEIRTVRPRFTRLTRVTATPPDIKALITFNNAGRAIRVELVRASGFGPIDEPVTNALYRWTASGKAIDELPRDDPSAGVTVPIRLVFR